MAGGKKRKKSEKKEEMEVEEEEKEEGIEISNWLQPCIIDRFQDMTINPDFLKEKNIPIWARPCIKKHYARQTADDIPEMLEIRDVFIPEMGKQKGVFAKRNIENNIDLGLYTGDIIWTEENKENSKSDKVLTLTVANWKIHVNSGDVDDFKTGETLSRRPAWSGLFNHKWRWPYVRLYNQPDIWRNFFSNIDIDDDGIITTIRNIKKDEEIFLDYQSQFWGNRKPIWYLGLDTNAYTEQVLFYGQWINFIQALKFPKGEIQKLADLSTVIPDPDFFHFSEAVTKDFTFIEANGNPKNPHSQEIPDWLQECVNIHYFQSKTKELLIDEAQKDFIAKTGNINNVPNWLYACIGDKYTKKVVAPSYLERRQQEFKDQLVKDWVLTKKGLAKDHVLGQYSGKVFYSKNKAKTSGTKYIRKLSVFRWQIFVETTQINNWQKLINHKWDWPLSNLQLPKQWEPFFSNIRIDEKGDITASRNIETGEELSVQYDMDFKKENPVWNFEGLKDNLEIKLDIVFENTEYIDFDFLYYAVLIPQLDELLKKSDVRGIPGFEQRTL